jgi:IS5 family transposase
MIRFLKARLGRVIREIERQTAGDDELAAGFADSLAKAQTIRDQALVKRAGRKIYSWHAPEVECIGKGKARAPYEFGCKATVTTTNGRARGGMFVLHAAALHGNPFDGHTLGRVLAETAEMTGVIPKRVHVDKGYRGHRQDRAVFDPETRRDVPPPWRVFISGRRRLPPALKAELRRRAAIEPVIGHLKADHRMGRNHLKGRQGDRFNVKMAAVGYNLRRLLQWLQDFVQFLISLWHAIIRSTVRTAGC